MTLKKVAVLGLAGLMSTSMLIGCGGKTGNNTANAGTKQDNTASQTEGGQENITITLMMSGTKSTEGEDFEIDTLPRLIKEKFPHITLEVIKLPDDQYYTTLKTKLATGEAPDFMLAQPRMAGANAVYTLAESGYLLDISGLSVLSKLGGVADMTYEGKTYAVPQGVTFLGTYYNKDVFKEHGLEVPTDWDQFLKVCETLKQAGITPIVMGDKDSYVMQFGLYQLAASRIYPQNPEFDNQLGDGTTKFTNGEWEEVLAMYAELYEKGYIGENSLGVGAAQGIQKFIDGEAAMTFDGTFNATALTAQGAASFERGFFPLPGNEAGKEVYTAGASGAGFGIYANTKYPEECRAILEYWYDGQSDLYKAWEATGRFISNYEGAPLNNPLFADMMAVYETGRAFYWCNQGWPAGVETEMQVKLSELIAGRNTTPADIADAMQMKFEELYNQ